ncbi:MAG: CPBP family intramembrane metalloprotease [Candidatus Abyssobacteria bacterium SURF_5]|uniref:CPBP family intramembrane metalloprotease n=1 Tax=Abyssobacteria bacterium (strain SURF_5) TaxID=2093360 RepID=A0A3A4NWF0_ABYX5|nr:MAG: CPBP family intramembrane metalloprotease [Candidatus Abyssubacteria bacterium SURF_5]
MDDNGFNLASGLQPDSRKQLLEVSVFLFLIFPSLIISLLVSQRQMMDFPVLAVSAILRDLALMALVFYFIWSNGEPMRRIGFTYRNVRTEVVLGVVLYVPFLLLISALQNVLIEAGLSAPPESLPAYLKPEGVGEYFLALVLVTVVAVSEEVIFRGYLILRFANVTGNLLLAALQSAVIFSLGHGYEGSAGVVSVGAMGLIFAGVYLWRMSLVAPIVMHFLQDFIGIIVAPLFT